MIRKGAAFGMRLRGNRVRITGCRATVSSQCFCAESHWVYKPEKAHKREQARKPAFPGGDNAFASRAIVLNRAAGGVPLRLIVPIFLAEVLFPFHVGGASRKGSEVEINLKPKGYDAKIII